MSTSVHLPPHFLLFLVGGRGLALLSSFTVGTDRALAAGAAEGGGAWGLLAAQCPSSQDGPSMGLSLSEA